MENLCKEYCPPLDEALLFALVHDYNLEDAAQLAALRQILDSLKDDAVQEQELELLPPTVETVPTLPMPATAKGNALQTADVSQRSQSTAKSTTEEDATASISTGLTELALSEGAGQGYQQDAFGYGTAEEAFEDLSDDQKVHWLCNMFPAVGDKDVRKTLIRSQGKFQQATDELLNLSFMNTEDIGDEATMPAPAIGIDGFAVIDEEAQGGKHSKSKKRRKKSPMNKDELGATYSDSGNMSDYTIPASPAVNAWTATSQDIEFITTRTHLKRKAIKSVYHANGARLPPTVRAFVMQESRKYGNTTTSTNDVMELQIDELEHYFPQVRRSMIYGALALADNTSSTARELLEILLTDNEEPVILGKLDGIASYTPLNLSDDESRPREQDSVNKQTYVPAKGHHTLTYMANSHGIAASNAFDQASAAWKRGKSDRLMGGAAAYYASVGQEHIKAARNMQAAEADAHVTRQSSSTSLDLHGVNVANAVRIARQRTENWWDGLGDRKYVPVGGVGNGYKIITGVGRHSSDGISRIGPAVSKMLVREGWKVEVGRGEVIVWGRARKH